LLHDDDDDDVVVIDDDVDDDVVAIDDDVDDDAGDAHISQQQWNTLKYLSRMFADTNWVL